jgi:hypothetical protein
VNHNLTPSKLKIVSEVNYHFIPLSVKPLMYFFVLLLGNAERSYRILKNEHSCLYCSVHTDSDLHNQ